MAKALDLRPDGTFIVRDGAREWHARRPTIGEWRGLVEHISSFDDRALGIERLTDPEERERERTAFRMAGGYAGAMAHVLTILSGGAIDVDQMPVWCTTATPLVSVMEHWRAVPLDLSFETEKATPELSLSTVP